MHRWFDEVPQGLMLSLLFSLLVIFGAFSWWFSYGGFEASPLGIWLGMYAWSLRGSFLCDPSHKSMGKGSQFWGFLWFRESGVLGGNPSIPLDLARFGGPNRGYGILMRFHSILKVLCEYVERIRRPGRLFGAVNLRLVVHPECSGPNRSDWCSPPVWTVPPYVGFWLGWTTEHIVDRC
jgi:hypothetical protein